MILQTFYKIIACHLLGDFFLQSDFIASSKGKNWYCLAVHCVLYTVPYAVCFGTDWRLAVLLLTHLPTDALKARYERIGLLTDQLIHYIAAALLYLLF